MPKSASLVLAYGIAITAVLWGLSLLLPALGQFLVILWQGLLAGVGLGIAAATTGFATAASSLNGCPKSPLSGWQPAVPVQRFMWSTGLCMWPNATHMSGSSPRWGC